MRTVGRGLALVAAAALVPAVMAPLRGGAASPPTVSVGDVTVLEGDSGTRTVHVPVTLSDPSSTQVTVDVAFAGATGVATVAADSVTFKVKSSGTTATFKHLAVKVTGNTADAADASGTITLSNPTGGAVLGRSTGTVEVLDDDPTAGPELGAGDATVAEGDNGTRKVRLPVTLSAPVASVVTVGYTTAPGSAASGSDYTAKAGGTITFQPGQLRKNVTVSVLPDAEDETDETMSVSLSGAVGATLSRATGTLTIADDDGGPSLSLRQDDPIVLTGADLPSLTGIAPGRLVAFRRAAGGWQQLPVQVDERAVVDFGTPYHSSPTGSSASMYTDAATWTGPDPDATLDADDEAAFMARDAGTQATAGAGEPGGVVSGSGLEVAIEDPLGAADPSRVYLFESDGSLDPAAGQSYVDYDFVLLSGDYKTTYDLNDGPNPESSVVTTSDYSMHFSDRWIHDGLSITAGSATGVDILDRHRSGYVGSCVRSEDTFADGEGAMIANRSGPVRAIRSYLGANSGPVTQRDHIMYPSSADVVTYLRVHAIPATRETYDYSAAALGMTLSTDTNPSGVTIDGVPDSYATTPAVWQMASGPQGSLVHNTALDSNWAYNPALLAFYYSDDSTPSSAPCTGDAYDYGVHGNWLNSSIPCTDPLQACTTWVTSRRHLTMLEPGATSADAAEITAQFDDPLTTTVASYP